MVLIGLGVLLIAAVVGAVIAFRRLKTSPFLRLVVVVVVVYVALAFALELRAVVIERDQESQRRNVQPVVGL
jgi:uncharacterized membrane protein YfcA